ncbi:hypothetical protein E2320_015941 [Naja naja]|nr:hypothetical protein E2320_015941 [Naja naja]
MLRGLGAASRDGSDVAGGAGRVSRALVDIVAARAPPFELQPATRAQRLPPEGRRLPAGALPSAAFVASASSAAPDFACLCPFAAFPQTGGLHEASGVCWLTPPDVLQICVLQLLSVREGRLLASGLGLQLRS